MPFAAGAVLSPKALNSLVASRRKASNRTYSLLRYGTVRKDLFQFLRQPPYNAIFENREVIAGLLDLMGNIRLLLPVLQSMEYFRKHDRQIAARVCRDHYERRDGSGYPRGLRLADGMVEIVAVSDIYDALISPRPYRPRAFDNRTALEKITRYAERNQIGWTALRALIARNRKSKPHYLACPVALTKRGTPPAENFYGIIAEDSSAAD